MESLKAVVTLVVTMTLLPFLTYASRVDDNNSSLPYCNTNGSNPITTPGEVCNAVYDALTETDDLCSKDDIVSFILTECMYGTINIV